MPTKEETLKEASESLHAILEDSNSSDVIKESAKKLFARIKKGLEGNEEEQIEAMGLEADLALRRFPTE